MINGIPLCKPNRPSCVSSIRDKNDTYSAGVMEEFNAPFTAMGFAGLSKTVLAILVAFFMLNRSACLNVYQSVNMDIQLGSVRAYLYFEVVSLPPRPFPSRDNAKKMP